MSGNELLVGENCYVNEIEILGDGKAVSAVSPADSSDIIYHDVANGSIREIQRSKNLHSASVSKLLLVNSHLLSVGRDGRVCTTDLRNGLKGGEFKISKYRCTDVSDADIYDAARLDNLLCISESCGFEGWDIRNTVKPLFSMQHHSMTVNALDIMGPANVRVLSTCDEGILNIVDPNLLATGLDSGRGDYTEDAIIGAVKLDSSSKKLVVMPELGTIASLQYNGGIEVWKLEGILACIETGTAQLLSSENSLVPSFWQDPYENLKSGVPGTALCWQSEDIRPIAQNMALWDETLLSLYNQEHSLQLFSLDQQGIRNMLVQSWDTLATESIIATSFNKDVLYYGSDRGRIVAQPVTSKL